MEQKYNTETTKNASMHRFFFQPKHSYINGHIQEEWDNSLTSWLALAG
jgi:hypothetical protein